MSIFQSLHGEWDLFEFDVMNEFWARRIDRKVSDEEEGLGFKPVLVARSWTDRKRLIEEQDLLEAKYNGARGTT